MAALPDKPRPGYRALMREVARLRLALETIRDMPSLHERWDKEADDLIVCYPLTPGAPWQIANEALETKQE